MQGLIPRRRYAQTAMLNWFRRKPNLPPQADLRGSFFADQPLEQFAAALKPVGAMAPWSLFRSAAEGAAKGDRTSAVTDLTRVLGTPGLESRVYLQAWKGLCDLGEAPAAGQAGQVLGMVLDVALEGGLDTLAAFADHSARYINQSGKVIVWDTRVPEVDTLIDALLEVGAEVVRQSAPLSGPRPTPPPSGGVRLYALTPGGVHTVEGSMETLSRDRVGGAALNRGARLMQALIDRATR